MLKKRSSQVLVAAIGIVVVLFAAFGVYWFVSCNSYEIQVRDSYTGQPLESAEVGGTKTDKNGVAKTGRIHSWDTVSISNNVECSLMLRSLLFFLQSRGFRD